MRISFVENCNAGDLTTKIFKTHCAHRILDSLALQINFVNKFLAFCELRKFFPTSQPWYHFQISNNTNFLLFTFTSCCMFFVIIGWVQNYSQWWCTLDSKKFKISSGQSTPWPKFKSETSQIQSRIPHHVLWYSVYVVDHVYKDTQNNCSYSDKTLTQLQDLQCTGETLFSLDHHMPTVPLPFLSFSSSLLLLHFVKSWCMKHTGLQELWHSHSESGTQFTSLKLSLKIIFF